jgi:hypothetical protein
VRSCTLPSPLTSHSIARIALGRGAGRRGLPLAAVKSSLVVLVAAGNDHVVNLEQMSARVCVSAGVGCTHLKHHPAQLGGEHKLLPLGDQGVDDKVLLHIVAARLHAVDA